MLQQKAALKLLGLTYILERFVEIAQPLHNVFANKVYEIGGVLIII
jgi:hypothetical protein